MPAHGAWERGGIIRRGGYVMAHRLTVTSLSVCVWGNRCATFEQARSQRASSDRDADVPGYRSPFWSELKPEER
jgi:hypothetical protein